MRALSFSKIPTMIYAHSFSIRNYAFYNRRYDFLEIVYITEGELLLTLDGIAYQAKEGDFFVIPPNTIADCAVPSNMNCHSHLSVGVRGEMQLYDHLDFETNGVFFCYQSHHHLQDSSDFEQVFTDLIYEFNHNNHIGAMGLFFQLCSMVDRFSKTNQSANSTHIYIRKIADYIENHISQKILISDIAKYLSITPEYTSRVFKEITGQTIVTYINKLKIKKAKQYLKRGGMSIEYVASMVGIDNIGYFCRLFKKLEGISPGEYKKSVQREFMNYNCD